LERLVSRLATAMLYAGAAALLVLTALVVIASFMRYFIGKPFAFTEELVALLYMAMVFLAIPLVTVKGTHITVSVMPEAVRRRIGPALRVGGVLVMIVFCAWFTVEAFNFVQRSRGLASRSEQFGLLLWPWMAVIPVTMALVTVIAVWQLFRPPLPPKDEGTALPLGDGL
jgi:TRAP-type C4-dicarboxylate transport system permease small subunit